MNVHEQVNETLENFQKTMKLIKRRCLFYDYII